MPEPTVDAIGVDAVADLIAPGSAPDLVVIPVTVGQVAPPAAVDEVIATSAFDLV